MRTGTPASKTSNIGAPKISVGAAKNNEQMFGILTNIKDDLMEQLYSPEKRVTYTKQ